MKVRNYHKIERRDAYFHEHTVGVGVRVAISVEDGAAKLAMRVIEIDPAGSIPKRSEQYEQAVYVTKGHGTITDGKRECRLEPDDVLFIPAGQAHQIRNTGSEKLVLISTIPLLEGL